MDLCQPTPLQFPARLHQTPSSLATKRLFLVDHDSIGENLCSQLLPSASVARSSIRCLSVALSAAHPTDPSALTISDPLYNQPSITVIDLSRSELSAAARPGWLSSTVQFIQALSTRCLVDVPSRYEYLSLALISPKPKRHRLKENHRIYILPPIKAYCYYMNHCALLGMMLTWFRSCGMVRFDTSPGNGPTNVVFRKLKRPQQQIEGKRQPESSTKLHVKT